MLGLTDNCLEKEKMVSTDKPDLKVAGVFMLLLET